MSDCKHEFLDTHLQGHKVCLKCNLTFNPRELELMARVAEMENLLLRVLVNGQAYPTTELLEAIRAALENNDE